MWTIRNVNPFSGKTDERKFKGKNAWYNAHKFAESQFNNYQQSIDVTGVETYRGKETGRTITRIKKYHVYDDMMNENVKKCMGEFKVV